MWRPLLSRFSLAGGAILIVLVALEIAIRSFGPILPGWYRTGPLYVMSTATDFDR